MRGRDRDAEVYRSNFDTTDEVLDALEGAEVVASATESPFYVRINDDPKRGGGSEVIPASGFDDSGHLNLITLIQHSASGEGERRVDPIHIREVSTAPISPDTATYFPEVQPPEIGDREFHFNGRDVSRAIYSVRVADNVGDLNKVDVTFRVRTLSDQTDNESERPLREIGLTSFPGTDRVHYVAVVAAEERLRYDLRDHPAFEGEYRFESVMDTLGDIRDEYRRFAPRPDKLVDSPVSRPEPSLDEWEQMQGQEQEQE